MKIIDGGVTAAKGFKAAARLTAENPPTVKDEDDQIQEYLTYICDDLLRDTLGSVP